VRITGIAFKYIYPMCQETEPANNLLNIAGVLTSVSFEHFQ